MRIGARATKQAEDAKTVVRVGGITVRAISVAAVTMLLCGAGVAQPVTIFPFAHSLLAGDHPTGTLLVDSSGALYGTTLGGNPNLPRDLGTVFKLSPPLAGQTRWSCTLLHLFTGGSDGSSPNGGLVMDEAGALYGTTPGSLVFKLRPPAAGQTAWTKTTIATFGGGTLIAAPLLRRPNGTLYGMIAYGPGFAGSSMFALLPPKAGHSQWTLKTIYSFTENGVAVEVGPAAALIADSSGALYGTTELGGAAKQGSVFKLSPPAAGQTAWTETELYEFEGGADGATPKAPVAFGPEGVLYGTTYGGGTNSYGTIFQLTPPASGTGPWTKTILFNLTPQSGGTPVDGVLVSPSGALYVTTLQGGSLLINGHQVLNGTGSVLELIPPAAGQTAWTEKTLYVFYPTSQHIHPSYPAGGLAFGLGGKLYGTTSQGGPGNLGTAFSLAP